MSVLRSFVAMLCLSSTLALAAEGECEDNFTECKDDCLIEFGGSVRVEVKKRFDKCMKKCTKTVNRCLEHVAETKANQLDEGALDGTPGSDEVDKQGMPTRSGSGGKKKKAADIGPDDPLEEDGAPQKKESLSDGEVPKSNRTRLKTDESSAPPPPPPEKAESKPEKKSAPREEDRVAEPAPKSEVIEMKMTRKKDEEDLRDDGPRASSSKPREEEPPPPPKKKKSEEWKPTPKKEEDHDDLRNY